MKRLIMIPVFLTFLAFNTTDTRNGYVISTNTIDVIASDIELDGDNDLVVGHVGYIANDNTALTIIENSGFGSLEVKETKTFSSAYCDILVNDFNNDLFPDIISVYAGKIRVYYNDTYGDYPGHVHFDLNNDAVITDIANGDINGDGFQDVVVISQNDQIWGILYNDGEGGFVEPEYYQLETPLTGVTCGDINGDGRDDIVVGGYYTNVYFSYEEGFEWQEYAFMFHEFYIRDFENDGDNDIICERFFGNQRLGIFENVGGQNLEIHYYQFTDFSGTLTSCSDLNNDTLPELVFTSYSVAYVIENTGSYDLKDPFVYAIPNHGGGPYISCGDLDENGYNDFIEIINKSAVIPNLYIFFNDGQWNFLETPVIKHQSYNPSPGYEFISSRIIPFEPDMTTILDTIMNGELGFVRSSQGEMLQKIGDEWVNGIGDWQSTEGYLFYLNDTANFDIVGTYIDPQTPIALEEGYQFISFLPGQPINALQAFYEVLYSLEFVRNSEGEMLMLIGNEWVNNIGNMQPKEGYLVKMHTGDTLVYPD